MKWFSNLKMKAKLIVCFIILAIFTGVVGAVGVNNMNGLNTRSENMYNNNFLPAQNLAKIQTALENVRANHLLALYERDPKTLQNKLDVIAKLAQQTNEMLKTYGNTINGEQERNL